MANVHTAGLDDLISEMRRLGEDVGPVAEDICMTCAEIIREEWEIAAEQAGHRITGGLIRSIGYARKPKRVDDAWSIAVYPQGTVPGKLDIDGRPLRRAAVAFRLHYGTRGNPGSRFVEVAETRARVRTTAKAQEIWERFLRQKG